MKCSPSGYVGELTLDRQDGLKIRPKPQCVSPAIAKRAKFERPDPRTVIYELVHAQYKPQRSIAVSHRAATSMFAGWLLIILVEHFFATCFRSGDSLIPSAVIIR